MEKGAPLAMATLRSPVTKAPSPVSPSTDASPADAPLPGTIGKP